MERAALSLATSVVCRIFSMLGAKAAPYLGGDITDEEMQHLQNIILPKIRTVLRVAEGVPVDELRPWLSTLQDAAYEAEDVLDTYEYRRLEAEVSPLPNYSLKKLKKKAKDFVSPLSLKTELKKSMEKLRQSADQADKLITLYGTISQTPLLRDTVEPQLPTVSSPSSPVFGRGKERKSLIKMLISTTDEHSSSERQYTPILAIYGLGGAGKTTLAQQVYNNSRVEKHFDTRMWVHVSRKFDVHMITTQIIESATKGECSNNINNLDVLQMKLKQILASKKFLLVLDDVWCHDTMQWDKMLVPLNEAGDTRSRILVTTRTQEVASKLGIENVVALKDLEYENCMSIFKYYSFGNAYKVIHDPELENVAEQIMKKLKKSPLSAWMVGSLLRGKKNVADWKLILKKGEMLKGTLNALCLSFDNLAPHLQRCFAICSLYPKGFHFDKWEVNALVRVWIAQGFVEAPDNNNMTIEDMGMQYFNELVSKSFFQKDAYLYHVIHDLLHDLAEDVSKDHCFRIEDDSEHIPASVRHLSIFSTKDLPSHILHTFKTERLRTFMIIHLASKEVDSDGIIDGKDIMFKKFKKLRVLHFGKNRLSELHKSIGQLVYLRYLQVYEVKRLPESLGRLYHLQFLDLKYCTLTEKVPENLNNLINLRFLHAGTEIISKVPLFGKLTSLRNIEKCSASRKKGHEIGQLKNLRHLRGSLCINKLENVQSKVEASEASLEEKKFVEELSLTWLYSQERDGRIDEEVIEGLVPPPNLNVLRIDRYKGIEFPEWLLDNGNFLCLSELKINNCPELMRVRSLPSTLKQLEVSGCETLNEMSSLPSGLRFVWVRDCPKLMQLSPYPPNVEELRLWKCPGVETLLSNILLFEGEDEQPNQKQKEKGNQHQFPLKILSLTKCSVSGKKRLFSDPNKRFTSLTRIILKKLPWLTSLFHPDHRLTSLKLMTIEDCENLELFGSPLASSSSLWRLIIRNCPRLAMQYSQSDMDGSYLLPSSLKKLVFDNCGDPDMTLLERCLLGLTSLTRLEICGYSHARSLPDFASPGAIECLWVSDCPELTSLWNLQPFSSLKALNVIGCPKLITGLGEGLPPSLIHLTIDDLSLLTALLPRREFLNSLEKLIIQSCTQAITFTEEQEELLQHLNSLTDLEIWNCPNLTSLPTNMEKLSLKELCIENCPKIELLPNLPASLKELRIDNCHHQLKAKCEKDGPLHHKVRHVTHASIW